MDGIKWKEAKKFGITKNQFNQLDTVNGSKNDKKIDQSVWNTVQDMLSEQKQHNMVNCGEDSLKKQIARILGFKEESSDTTNAYLNVMVVDDEGNAGASGSVTNSRQNELVQEGERALAYYHENKTLEGFELNRELINEGYKVEIDVEKKFDDVSNDKYKVTLEGDKYSYETEKVADSVSIRVIYTKTEVSGEQKMIIVKTHKSEAPIDNNENRKNDFGI